MSRVALTEKRNPNTRDIDLMDSIGIVRAINNEDKKVAAAVEKVLPEIARAVDAIAKAFMNGGRLGYFGAGTSGRIGILDASECPPTFGAPEDMVQAFIAGGDRAIKQAAENAEDRADFAREDVKAFNPSEKDAVVSISASGNPDYAVEVLKAAREYGALTIAVTSNPEAKMKADADIFINPLVGEEAVAGSSRMKSGTMQKMVLNLLTTGAMIRIGKTYENLMVDVSVSNKKLYDRACRIISEITGVDYPAAEQYLKDSGLKVKTACVMALKNCSKAQAESLLDANGGILRKVI